MTRDGEITHAWAQWQAAEQAARYAETDEAQRQMQRFAAEWHEQWLRLTDEHNERVTRELARARQLEWEMGANGGR